MDLTGFTEFNRVLLDFNRIYLVLRCFTEFLLGFLGNSTFFMDFTGFYGV